MPAASLTRCKHRQFLDKKPASLPDVEHTSDPIARILEAMPSGIIILDADGIVTQANPVALNLLGEPLEGQPWLHIINRAFAPQDDDGHEVSLRNGRRVKLAITPLAPEPGQLIVITDLTETRLLQKNLSHLQRLSALGKMVASLAHQIRTPLSAALLYAANLSGSQLNPESRDKFQKKLVDRLNELERQVNDMLLMAKGRQEDVGNAVMVADIFSAVLENCEPIAARDKALLTVINDTCGPVLANINSLSSAIGNLVINSLEAGATEIKLRSEETHDSLLIEVADNGSGLDDKLQQQVLEPFFTTKIQGTGLGLAVVQSVIHNHGGSFQLICQPAQGCTAQIKLPLYDKTAAQ